MVNTFVKKTYLLAYGRFLVLCKSLLVTILLVLNTQAVKAQDTITIVAFGDSLTRGYGLPEDQGLVPQLQAWLRANGGGNIRVLNAGLSGDTTAGGLSRIDWTLDDDVDAVIVALGGNDMLRGIPPESSRENLDGILTRIAEHELPAMLIGLPSPTNFGPEFKAGFDAMYPELAEEHQIPLYPFFFEGFGVGQDTASMRPFMQNDGTHPNAEGVSLIVADLGPLVLELASRVTP